MTDGKRKTRTLYNRHPVTALANSRCPTLLIEPGSPYEAFFTQTDAIHANLQKHPIG